MNTEQRQITVSGLRVMIERKSIKNLHLGVYPPHGRVRVAAPLAVTDDAVRLAVISKLKWIKRQQSRFKAQPRQSSREWIRGESHFFLGRRYRLRIVPNPGAANVVLRGSAIMDLHLPSPSSTIRRERVLRTWYRQQLKELIPPLVKKWQEALDVQVTAWGIKRMKTKWGSCNALARRIWLNLELAKKPVQCLDYIVLHEMAHLIERRHNEHFVSILDKHLPQWRLHRAELNSGPLAHETWQY